MAAAVDPYKAYSDMYKARTDAIAAQTKQAETERAQREQAAQQTLANSNRGVYTTYKNAINPYGRMASQNNFSQGVSDYYNNASYGTMLQGLGSNQYNYNDAMNNSNSLWQNYLAQKAGNEADALNDYNTAVVAQQKYDEEQKIAEQERQEAIRQFNLQLQLKQEAEKAEQARWEAEQAENKRRYDQEWAYQMEQAAKASSSGSSGGGSSRSGGGSGSSGYEFVDTGSGSNLSDYVNSLYDTAAKRNVQNNYTSYGAMDQRHATSNTNNTVIKTQYKASGTKGKSYKIVTYADGRTVNLGLVNQPSGNTTKRTTTTNTTTKKTATTSKKKNYTTGVKGH